MDRRTFFMSSAAATAAQSTVLASPNETVRVACVGFNGRGVAHLRAYPRIPNTQIAALCDVDEAVLEKGLKMVETATGKRPAAYTDLRKLLEDKTIDTISIATPNHQHTLQTIWGCQAGKDVYVEKPCAYNMFEAKQIVAAARKYNRMVQHGAGGSQVMAEARDRMKEGMIGDLYMARGLVYKFRDTIGRAPVEAVPKGVHYDLWLGPAPKHEFTRNRFHYNFHWFWDYGNGDIGNQGIHQMHAARFGLGVGYPTKVSAFGGHYMFDDDQETPNTMVALFEFDDNGKKKQITFEVRHWYSNNEAGIRIGGDDFSGPAKGVPMTVGNVFYGSKGYLAIDGNYGNFKTYMGREQAPGPEATRKFGNTFSNFVDCVRSRKREDLVAEVEDAAISTTLVHLANISYRVGRTLHFDAKSYSCKGDEEANRMFTRPRYREGFVVPKLV